MSDAIALALAIHVVGVFVAACWPMELKLNGKQVVGYRWATIKFVIVLLWPITLVAALIGRGSVAFGQGRDT